MFKFVDVDSVSAGNDWFSQQNITQVRKSFITQSKLLIIFE